MRIPCVLATLFVGCATIRGDIIHTPLADPLWLNADPPLLIGQGDRHDIDLDGNGTFDFSFTGNWSVSVSFRSQGINRYLIVPEPPPNIGGPVAALEEGVLIEAESDDGGLSWFGDNHDYVSGLMLNLSTGESGEFWDKRAYIGIEFQMDDGTHYGWFDVQGSSSGNPTARIHGWAYESTPGMGITAGAIPEPSTVLLFASGIVAIFMSRAKNRNR